MDDRVYGLKGVVDLVTTCMTRVERDGTLRSVDFPVLVVEGFRGTGKTAVLSRLDGLLDQIPHARIDLEKNRHASVPAVLSAIAFDLSKKYPRYELRFPRFIVGQLVAGLELDLTDHAQASRQVVAALEHHRDVDAVREVLVDAADTVLAVASPIRPPRGLLRHGVDWLSKHAPGRNLALGSYQSWYGHRDLGLHNDPIDTLVDLNRWAADVDDEDNRQRIDELLWSAFLADLRSEFDRGRRADERSLNCVVLLDNVDSALGRRFLDQLVHARRQRAVGDQDDPDPLTVVATSRGLLLDVVPEADRIRVEPDEPLAEALWTRYWWLGYRLPDLTRDEVDRAIADLGLALRKQDRLTRTVYGLTDGHQASAALVLDVVARHPPEKWVEPESLLAHTEPGPDDQPVTVEQRMLDRLLLGISDAELRDLVTCAPARLRAHALALVGQGDLLATGQSGYDEVIDPLLWPVWDSAGLAVLRRLLLRCLAGRTGVSPTWAEVFTRLRSLCQDESGDLYYALAAGELGFVAGHLRGRLTELTSTEWFALATSVAAAPYRPRARELPIDEVRGLVTAAGLPPESAAVGRLVAGLHIAADPCTDSRRRDVHLQLADDVAEVARLCPGGPHAVFLEASRRHRREAEWWD